MNVSLPIVDSASFEFLSSVPVSQIQRRDYELVMVEPSQTVEEVLRILAENSISAAPVFDVSRQLVLGTISVLDLTIWIVRTFALSRDMHFDDMTIDMQMNTPVKETMNWGLDPFWPISRHQSIQELTDKFAFKVHRLPVVDLDYHICGAVSQSDVIHFLTVHQDKLNHLTSKSLKELNLSEGPVTSVSDKALLIHAFSQIVETQYTGIAVVDASGKLVSTISASDIKGITRENFKSTLLMPLERFASTKIPPQTLSGDSTLGDVISRMAEMKIHRIFVVDSDGKPNNVITMTSIMNIFASHSGQWKGQAKQLQNHPLALNHSK